MPLKECTLRDFQWLSLHTSTAGGMGSIPGQVTKILHATAQPPRNKQPFPQNKNKTHKTATIKLTLKKTTKDIPYAFHPLCLQRGIGFVLDSLRVIGFREVVNCSIGLTIRMDEVQSSRLCTDVVWLLGCSDCYNIDLGGVETKFNTVRRVFGPRASCLSGSEGFGMWLQERVNRMLQSCRTSGEKRSIETSVLMDGLPTKFSLPTVYKRGCFPREGSRGLYISENHKLGLLEANPKMRIHL